MDLRRLRYFVAVAEELHFGRAAQRLRVAQPAVSQQIRRLEAELGVELLRRSGRGVELTSSGELLLEESRSLLAHAGRVEELMRRSAEGTTGRLAIGFVRAAGLDLLPSILRVFHERHPDVALSLHEKLTADQIDALRAGTIDVGILRPHIRRSEILFTSLRHEHLLVAMPAHSPDDDQSLPLDMLREKQFVFLARHVAPEFFDLIVSACERVGFVPKIAQEAADMDSIMNFVAAGTFVAFVPESARTIPRPHITYRRIEGLDTTVELALASRRDDNSLLVARFREIAALTAGASALS